MDMTRRSLSDHNDWLLMDEYIDCYDRNDQRDTRLKNENQNMQILIVFYLD